MPASLGLGSSNSGIMSESSGVSSFFAERRERFTSNIDVGLADEVDPGARSSLARFAAAKMSLADTLFGAGVSGTADPSLVLGAAGLGTAGGVIAGLSA